MKNKTRLDKKTTAIQLICLAVITGCIAMLWVVEGKMLFVIGFIAGMAFFLSLSYTLGRKAHIAQQEVLEKQRQDMLEQYFLLKEEQEAGLP